MYQKHTWVSKEVIRREYLQNIEDGIYNEQERAIAAENALSGSISEETSRAVVKENALSASIVELNNNLTSETSRAVAKENTLEQSITDEVNRALTAEGTLSETINSLAETLSDETARAIARENSIDTALTAETSRATQSENTLSSKISTETTRATGAETQLQTNLTAEVARATQAEIDLHDYVDAKVSATLHPKGTITFANLPSLSASVVNYVYNISDSFTTTSDFTEGSGKHYPSGTNVAIVNIGTESNPTYKYDAMSGFIDTSHFITDTDYATNSKAGIVKPDGTTITIAADGTISSVGGGQGSAEAVERMIAPIEADATESTHVYAIGSRLILNELLYEVIDDIAIGDALITYEDDPTNANIKLSDDVTTMIKNKTITIDQTVTQGSANAVSGGAVYTYIDTMITQAISASY